ncbi:DUF4390 domain-containing protein [Sapientia aquatica]|uniref:DUF4390 domain-containing protein n=1 Tax=Sapientia aquatica TaxID=1549640 RepID=A0A4R5VTG1_9BURK|nr:DUF4390 domain-containing protein [Sapientia aquatica]TDK61342.1 DUF4390 domain-containing protein [Sapientia aquatica]
MHRIFKLLLLTLLSCLLCSQPLAYAGNIEISHAQIESSDEGYRLAASFNFELSRDLENTLTSGIPLYFVTEVEITRPRWYWFDEKTITGNQTVRISYNVLTRQYRASVNGSFPQNYKDLDDALALVRHPSRWTIAERSALNRGATYNVSVRLRLDTSQLPKPLQFNALNDSDWRLASDWKRMTFKADDK